MLYSATFRTHEHLRCVQIPFNPMFSNIMCGCQGSWSVHVTKFSFITRYDWLTLILIKVRVHKCHSLTSEYQLNKRNWLKAKRLTDWRRSRRLKYKSYKWYNKNLRALIIFKLLENFCASSFKLRVYASITPMWNNRPFRGQIKPAYSPNTQSSTPPQGRI